MKKFIAIFLIICVYGAYMGLIWYKAGKRDAHEHIQQQIESSETSRFIEVGDTTYLIRYFPL